MLSQESQLLLKTRITSPILHGKEDQRSRQGNSFQFSVETIMSLTTYNQNTEPIFSKRDVGQQLCLCLQRLFKPVTKSTEQFVSAPHLKLAILLMKLGVLEIFTSFSQQKIKIFWSFIS